MNRLIRIPAAVPEPAATLLGDTVRTGVYLISLISMAKEDFPSIGESAENVLSMKASM